MSRYFHRIAISNNRILKIENGKVTFIWRDDADGDKQKVMTVDAEEFIRRFMLHELPDRYVKIRHFGLFILNFTQSMRSKKSSLNHRLCASFRCCFKFLVSINIAELFLIQRPSLFGPTRMPFAISLPHRR
ncbi:MAG: transposase [Nitrospirae bacterium]|nr:transposase [Nitrospirota bacterium]